MSQSMCDFIFSDTKKTNKTKTRRSMVPPKNLNFDRIQPNKKVLKNPSSEISGLSQKELEVDKANKDKSTELLGMTPEMMKLREQMLSKWKCKVCLIFNSSNVDKCPGCDSERDSNGEKSNKTSTKDNIPSKQLQTSLLNSSTNSLLKPPGSVNPSLLSSQTTSSKNADVLSV